MIIIKRKCLIHSQSFCTALEAKFVNYYNVKSVSFPIATATKVVKPHLGALYMVTSVNSESI